jgi:chromosome segregation ATPase
MMSLSDLFKTQQYKETIETLKNENAELTNRNNELTQQANLKLTASQMKPAELNELIKKKQDELSSKKSELSNIVKTHESTLSKLTTEESNLRNEISNLTSQISSLKKELDDTEDKLNMQSYGLYKPRYDFANSLGYKARLDEVRQTQKRMIRSFEAYSIFTPMTLNNSEAKGRSMQKKNGKQLIRAFNGECEAAINKITYSNIDRIEKRIHKSYDQLNKLNDPNGISIAPEYLDSKIDELHLAYEYSEKKQEEKDELREQREREREDKKAQKQIQDAQKKLNKELDHYKKALVELTAKLSTLEGKERDDVQQSIDELNQNISKGEAEKNDLDYRQENATAGYVYIISNIGSFGPDVVKIGVTRRLDPQERIDELGSASVPFKFDVHAFIFSYDAYSLEAELHQRFNDKRINKVNNRKEYFHVSIDEIEKVLEEYKDLTVDFHEIPEAVEYNQSLALEH